MRKSRQILWMMAVAALVSAGRPALAGDLARMQADPLQVQWQPQGDYERAVLTVTTPGGTVIRREVAAGKTPSFELGQNAADGSYTWELRFTPRLDPGVRQQLAAAREKGNTAALEGRLRAEGKLPSGPLVQSGTFTVAGGAIVRPDLTEERGATTGVRVQAAGQVTNITAADQVIPDDLIVQGSTCVGFDCVNNESFGFDTIRLKENSTRIKFEDTSVGSFPSNDWQLTANDSASGGANKFSIEDITGSKVPFTITAGAATNSIFLDSTGRLGLRTSTPVLDIHVNTSNTPAIRLEQNNSGGFTAQTWDIAGNEANFFVRDVTGGSRLPFRIRPGAPTSSVDISASGNVGIGTASPSQKLHVSGSDGATEALVTETSGTTALRTLLELSNNGASRLNITDTSTGATFGINNSSGNINMIKSGAGVTAFTLTGAGALTIPSTMTAQSYVTSSDREMKKDIVPVHADEVLAKLATLPISTWTFKTDDVPHLGPMAQDFVAAFGLGPDDKHISLTDMAGVSLAAVQALHQEMQKKDATLAELRQENADLAKRLADLEALVA
jgi:hypothetical protein